MVATAPWILSVDFSLPAFTLPAGSVPEYRKIEIKIDIAEQQSHNRSKKND